MPTREFINGVLVVSRVPDAVRYSHLWADLSKSLEKFKIFGAEWLGSTGAAPEFNTFEWRKETQEAFRRFVSEHFPPMPDWVVICDWQNNYPKLASSDNAVVDAYFKPMNTSFVTISFAFGKSAQSMSFPSLLDL